MVYGPNFKDHLVLKESDLCKWVELRCLKSAVSHAGLLNLVLDIGPNPYTFNYQNHDLCRVPVFSIWGFRIKKDLPKMMGLVVNGTSYTISHIPHTILYHIPYTKHLMPSIYISIYVHIQHNGRVMGYY